MFTKNLSRNQMGKNIQRHHWSELVIQAQISEIVTTFHKSKKKIFFKWGREGQREGGRDREREKKKTEGKKTPPILSPYDDERTKSPGTQGHDPESPPLKGLLWAGRAAAVKQQLSFSKRLGRARPPNRGQKILSKSQEQELGRRRWAGAEDVSYQWPPLDSCSFVTCPKSIPFQSDSNLGDIFFHCILTEFLHLPTK